MRNPYGVVLLILLIGNSAGAWASHHLPSIVVRPRAVSPTTSFIDLDRELDLDAVEDYRFPEPPEGADDHLRTVLATKVDLSGIDEKLTLEELMELMALRYNLKSDVHGKAFKVAEIEVKQLLHREFELPKEKGVPLSKYLRDCLARIGCSYMTRGDMVVVIPRRK
jgi:hypothetical protein